MGRPGAARRQGRAARRQRHPVGAAQPSGTPAEGVGSDGQFARAAHKIGELVNHHWYGERDYGEANRVFEAAMPILQEGLALPRASVSDLLYLLTWRRRRCKFTSIRDCEQVLLANEVHHPTGLLPSILVSIIRSEQAFGELNTAKLYASRLLHLGSQPGNGLWPLYNGHYFTGLLSYELGRYGDALHHFEVICSEKFYPLFDDHSEVWNQALYCLALLELGRYSEVRTLLDGGLPATGSTMYPPSSLSLKVRLLFKENDPQRALECLKDGNVHDQFLEGEIQSVLGHFEAAAAAYEASRIETQPCDILYVWASNHTRFVDLAIAVNALQAKQPGALENLETAISQTYSSFPTGHPRLASALIVQSSALLELGRNECACTTATKSMRMLEEFLGWGHPTVCHARTILRLHLKTPITQSAASLADDWLHQQRSKAGLCSLM